jgi:hypothetical protein
MREREVGETKRSLRSKGREVGEEEREKEIGVAFSSERDS